MVTTFVSASHTLERKHGVEGEEECTQCYSCTCHGAQELALPCSPVVVPKRVIPPENLNDACWQKGVYAWVRELKGSRTDIWFHIEAEWSGKVYEEDEVVHIHDFAYNPDLYEETLTAMVYCLEDQLIAEARRRYRSDV